MNLINFAYGELIMIGAFALYLLDGVPWPLQLLACLAGRDGRRDGHGADRVPAVPRRQRAGAAGDVVRAQLRSAERSRR